MKGLTQFFHTKMLDILHALKQPLTIKRYMLAISCLTLIVAAILIGVAVLRQQSEGAYVRHDAAIATAHSVPDFRAYYEHSANPAQNRPDLYEKLRSGSDDVTILVLGDTIGASAGVTNVQDTWHYQLTSALSSIYSATSSIHTLATGSDTVMDGLVDYHLTPTADAYDLVILSYDYPNQEQLSYAQFARAYEQLIHTIRKDKQYPEFYLLVGHQVHDETYLQIIARLAEYYHLEVVNMNEAFADSELTIDTLTSNGGLPNAVGYLVYRGAILRTIEEQLQQQKTVYRNDKLPLQQLDGEPVLLNDFTASDGFQHTNNIHWSDQAEESLSLQMNNELLGIMAYHTYESGIVDVYLDDHRVASIDLYGPNRISIHWISHPAASSAKEITLRVTGKKSSKSVGTKVGIIGVVAN